MKDYSYTTRSRSFSPGGGSTTTYKTTTRTREEVPSETVQRTYRQRTVPAGITNTKTYTTKSRVVPAGFTKTYRYDSSPSKVTYDYHSSSSPVTSRTSTYHYEKTPTVETRGRGRYREEKEPLASINSGRRYYDMVTTLDRNSNSKFDRLAKLSQYETEKVSFPANYDYGHYGPSYVPQRKIRSQWKYNYHTNCSNFRNRKVDSSFSRIAVGDRPLPSHTRYVISYFFLFTYLDFLFITAEILLCNMWLVTSCGL